MKANRMLFLLVFLVTLILNALNTKLFAVDTSSFERFIKPITNPVYFDEAQNISYVHLVNAYQDLPKRINTKVGRIPLDGYLNFTAVRLIYAFNEKFSLIAAKDGYISFKPDNTLKNEYGWGDIAAGIKGALYYCPETEFIVSGKLLFEFTQGSGKVFQGNGDGNATPSVTFFKGL